jgi:hypothetical protein
MSGLVSNGTGDRGGPWSDGVVSAAGDICAGFQGRSTGLLAGPAATEGAVAVDKMGRGLEDQSRSQRVEKWVRFGEVPRSGVGDEGRL